METTRKGEHTLSGSARRIAVFDIDRTLILGTSCEVQLARYLRSRRLLRFRNVLRGVGGMIMRFPKGLSEAVYRNRTYLYGFSEQKLRSLIPDFFDEALRPLLNRTVEEKMEGLREKGYEIILITGTLNMLLDAFIAYYHADGGVGATMEASNGVLKGWIIGNHPYQEGKVEALFKYLDGKKVDLEASFCFADSWSDISLLSLFGHPVVVNPGRRLRKKAERENWSILESR